MLSDGRQKIVVGPGKITYFPVTIGEVNIRVHRHEESAIASKTGYVSLFVTGPNQGIYISNLIEGQKHELRGLGLVTAIVHYRP